MAKKRKTTKLDRRKLHDPSQQDRNAAINARLNQIAAATVTPSHRAMGLAEAFIKRARTKNPDRQAQIAEMIDAALRVDSARGEVLGSHEATQNTTNKMVREIIEGVMSRVAMASRMVPQPVAITLSFTEAKYIRNALAFHGYRDGTEPSPATEAMAWQVVRDGDDAMHATLGRKAA